MLGCGRYAALVEEEDANAKNANQRQSTPINAKDEDDASHLVRRLLLVLLIRTMAPRQLVVARAMVCVSPARGSLSL